MKKFFIFSATFCSVVFMLILVSALALSAYDYFAGPIFEDSYPLFCDILYGEILKYDVLLVLVFFVLAFVQAIIEDRKEA